MTTISNSMNPVSNGMKKKVAVFDLDYTLIECNSTFDFILFYLKKKRKVFPFLFLKSYSFFEAVFLLKILSEKKREVFLSYLRKESLKDIKRASLLFTDITMQKKLNDGLYDKLKEKKKEGYFCILASASLNCIVEDFCKKLGFDSFIATELDFKNNIFTGKIKSETWGLKHKKIEKLEQKIGKINYKESFCYSDNREDLPLLQKFGNSFGVVRDNIEKFFWKEHHIKTTQHVKTFHYNKKLLLFPLFYYFYRGFSLRSFFFFYTTFLILVLIVYDLLSLLNLLILLFSWLGFVSLYEVGYFVNDCISVKKEKGPCYRADKNICSFIKPFILSRFLFFGLILVIIASVFNVYIYYHLLLNILVFIVFLIHNSISIQKRFLTVPFLKSTHLWIPLVVFNLNIINIIILTILLYLPKEILYYQRKKGYLTEKKNKKNIRFFTAIELLVFFKIFIFSLLGFISWKIFFLAGWLSIINFIRIFNFSRRLLLLSSLVRQSVSVIKKRNIGKHSLSEEISFVFSPLLNTKNANLSISPVQIKSEIFNLMNKIEKRKPKIVCEIGTVNGGALYLLTRVSSSNAIIISIDLPEGKFGGGYSRWKIPIYKSFAKKNQKIHLIRDDSHKYETLEKLKKILKNRQIDFLFIDGDHTYEGVKKDFEMYSPLVKKGGVVGFHDIAKHPPETKCEVGKLWNKIKNEYNHEEIVESYSQGGYGIGIIFK